MDDRLCAGQEGEVKVFWAAVSWIEAERSRRSDADKASWLRTGLGWMDKPHTGVYGVIFCVMSSRAVLMMCDVARDLLTARSML